MAGVTRALSPNPRYVTGLLAAATCLLITMAFMVSRPNRYQFAGVTALASILFLSVFLQKGYLGSALLNPVMANGEGIYGAHSPPEAVVQPFVTESGLVLKYAPDWQCWLEAPPCTFSPNPELELRGETLREGFRIRQ